MKMISTFLIPALAAFYAVSSAHAATVPPAAAIPPSTAEIKEQTSRVSESQDELASVKDDLTLSPEEKLAREIAARKKIVAEALALSLKEVESLKNGLLKLPRFEEGTREYFLTTEFLIKIVEYSDYYADKATALKNAANLKIDEVKSMAKDIITYRDTVYNPDLKKIVDFILVFYNQDAIATTNSRLEKINADIRKLEKLNLLKADLFKANLEKSAELIREALSLQAQAKALILAVPDEKTSGEAIAEPADETKKPGANELITASLGKVKATYEVFLQISRDIKKAVGIR